MEFCVSKSFYLYKCDFSQEEESKLSEMTGSESEPPQVCVLLVIRSLDIFLLLSRFQ